MFQYSIILSLPLVDVLRNNLEHDTEVDIMELACSLR